MIKARCITIIFVAVAVMALCQAASAWPQQWIGAYGGAAPPEDFAETWGVNPERAGSYYGENDVLSVQLIKSSVPANILWPGDKPVFTFQFVNRTDQPVDLQGKGLIIQYGVHTMEFSGHVSIHKIADVTSFPVSVKIDANGYQNIDLTPPIPEKMGGYALIFDFDGQDRLFGATCARTYKANITPMEFHRFTMDAGPVEVLSRLGAAPNRFGIGYKPTTDADFDQWYEDFGNHMQKLMDAGLPVTIEFGGGGPQPLGRGRPWLDENDVMLNTKSDYAWLPEHDDDFQKLVKIITSDYGWPKGPINGVMLWNEPWEGMSISGWGADMPRYREIYTAMAKGVEQAREEADVNVLIGGCDSSSNTFDKLFGDGSDKFLKWLDFMSIHYQGMSPVSMVKKFRNREPRVLIWDTESWVANSEDRIPAVICTNFATGHDRCVGIQSDAVVYSDYWINIRTANGTERRHMVQAWPVAAGIGALQHLIGHRAFNQILFKNGLPWVYLFDGAKDASGKAKPDDGTVVVIGDLGPAFGAENLLFRTVRGLQEVAHEQQLRKKMAALPADATAEREKLQEAINTFEELSGATMTIDAEGARFSMYDFYGNPVPVQNDEIVVPLDGRGFYLRPDGTPGSYAALVEAVKTARIEGYEPLETVVKDMLKPIDEQPVVMLKLTNILNRPVQGTLNVSLGELKIDYPKTLDFAAHETKMVPVKVTGGNPTQDNTYALSLNYDAGADGTAVHHEKVHCNVIAHRTITVDGNLDDWQNCLPQVISQQSSQAPTAMEYAWQPFKEFDRSMKKGYSTAWLAYDDQYFYFAAKVADATPDGGTLRFETRDDDQFYYPETSYVTGASESAVDFSVRWTGFIKPKYTEEYTFSTQSDDGVRLWINNQQLIDNWTGHAATWDTGTIELEAGKLYPIKIEYMQGSGGAIFKFFWQSQSQGRGIVPTAALYPTGGKAIATGTGLTAEIYRGTNMNTFVQKRVDKLINYEGWGGNITDKDFGLGVHLTPLEWPEGVRRYSYRKNPILPAGNSPNFDNVQIAFNVLAEKDKPWFNCPPGTMPRFTTYICTDYQYALNKVDEEHGGGTEIWRLQRPGMPIKHFYPRQGKSPYDGPVKSGKLVVNQGDTTRIVEAAIPWSELPDVKKRLDTGQTVKFSYRVNDNSGVGCMELSRLRSVAKRNQSFYVHWTEHWANELEFSFQK